MTPENSRADALTYLLPCAFCGCTKTPIRQGNGIGDFWLECSDCGASTRLREDGAGSEKDWNRRPDSQPAAAPIDMREAFAEAAVSLGMHDLTRMGDDEYLRDPVNICWLTWKAACAWMNRSAPSPADERAAFEAKFPMPPDCIWTGKGYSQTRHDAWRAQGYAKMWEGWQARAASAPKPADTLIGYICADDLKELAVGNGAIVSPRSRETDVPVFARAASASETGAEGTQWRAALIGLLEVVEARNSNGGGLRLNAEGQRRVDATRALLASRSPAMAAEAVAIPAGWVLVPVEPTPEMLDCWWDGLPKGTAFQNCTPRGVYAAMLAVAPQPAQADAPADTRELPTMRNAFRVTEVSGDPDPAKQSFAMRFSFPSIEALHAADDEWNKFIAAAQADAREGLKDERLAKIRLGLTAAKHFIANGIELGFIRMSDADCPDPAHNTPKLIDDALALLQGAKQ